MNSEVMHNKSNRLPAIDNYIPGKECAHRWTRGNDNGKYCGRITVEGSEYCVQHSKDVNKSPRKHSCKTESYSEAIRMLDYLIVHGIEIEKVKVSHYQSTITVRFSSASKYWDIRECLATNESGEFQLMMDTLDYGW
jgi:hypothetical protein